MPVKPSEEEEKYFQAENQRQIAALRDEIEADEDTSARWLEIADGVGSRSLMVGRSLEQLGFTAETSRILFFVPVLEVAWADGSIDYKESSRLVDLVREKGVRATSPAFEFLSRMTLSRPSDEFFAGCRATIRAIFDEMPAADKEESARSLGALSLAVAHASGGFMGFGAKVNEEEKEAIRELFSALGLQDTAQATQLLTKI